MAWIHVDLASKLTPWGFTEQNAMLAALRAMMWAPVSLGGSRVNAHTGASYQAVYDAIPWTVPSSRELGTGGIWTATVFMRCEDGTMTTITPKIRRVDSGGSDAVVSATPCTGTAADWSGADQIQYLTFVPVVDAIYELWATKSNTLRECFIMGVIARTDT